MMPVVVLLVFVIHMQDLPFEERILIIKPTDEKAIGYFLVNLCSLVIGALIYGKPYSPKSLLQNITVLFWMAQIDTPGHA